MLRTLALVLAASVVPATAFADDAPGARPGVEKRGEGHGKGHRAERGDRPSFPMKGGDFIQHVETRIQKTRERVQAGMTKREVPAAKQKEVLAEIDAGSAKVLAAAQQAAADGTVTQPEAKGVREVAHEAKKGLREKAGMNKGQRDGKGRKDGKGSRGEGRKGTPA
jgi:hypothetical protein